jgi:hypothetical protein
MEVQPLGAKGSTRKSRNRPHRYGAATGAGWLGSTHVSAQPTGHVEDFHLQVRLCRRDTGTKEEVPFDGLGIFLVQLLDTIQMNLLNKSRVERDGKIALVSNNIHVP